MTRYFLKSEAGWSLPFTWSLLVIIVLLVYFFGWLALPVVAILFGLITLGVYIHDRMTPLPEFNDIFFWFNSNQSLDAIWQKLAPKLQAGGYDLEAENVWEWIEAYSPERQLVYNLSRKHKDYTYPVILRVQCQSDIMQPDTWTEIGQLLAGTLRCAVKSGTVSYISSNDYEFNQEALFTNSASSESE